MNNADEPLTATTGQDCPRSGLWCAQGISLPPLLVRQGHIMPAAHGKVVTWTLQEQAPPGRDTPR